MKLSVYHSLISMIRFEINGVEVPYRTENGLHVIELDYPCEIEIFFEPWKITPYVRRDNHLLEYKHANIKQFDHMIKFYWAEDFYDNYFESIKQSKIQYLELETQEEIDYFLGVDNHHEDLINKIYAALSKF